MDKHVLIVLFTVVVLALLRVAVWGIVQHRRRRADVPGRHSPRVRPNPLSHQQRQRYANAWRLIEDRFPEDPALALSQADRQVVEVMKARGYPVATLEQHPDEVARDNPELVENFRAARRILRAHGKQTKELLHQAMIHYRALFDDLVEVPVTEWQQAGS
jgi:hypothetical protein